MGLERDIDEYSTLLIDATGPGSHTTNAGTDRRRAVQIVVRVRILCEGYESRARTEIGHPKSSVTEIRRGQPVAPDHVELAERSKKFQFRKHLFLFFLRKAEQDLIVDLMSVHNETSG